MKLEALRPSELAPCGVYCGACPSFGGTCLGCASESRAQKRTSKWGCKIRACCLEREHRRYCIECERFPCDALNRKLLQKHVGERRFRYRHEIPEVFPKLLELGTEGYLEYQKQRWTCRQCGGRVHFYHYRCGACGAEQLP